MLLIFVMVVANIALLSYQVWFQQWIAPYLQSAINDNYLFMYSRFESTINMHFVLQLDIFFHADTRLYVQGVDLKVTYLHW